MVDVKIESLSDQTSFSTTQSVMQTPPELEMSKSNKKRNIFLILLILVMVIFLLGVWWAMARQAAEIPLTPPPTTEPTASVSADRSLLEIEIDQVDNLINQANPRNLLLYPPPVDMNVDF